MSHEKKYRVNECFLSLQGEGARSGSANVFVRFSNCNLRCDIESVGWSCDTEFISGRDFSLSELVEEVRKTGGNCRSIVFTGGEPALQMDDEIIKKFHEEGFYLAIETNGTLPLPEGLDWICVSPKTADHTLRVLKADEVKYVRHTGQALPAKISIQAVHKFVSPAFTGTGLDTETLSYCTQLVKENPEWKLSVQLHKLWKIR